MGEVRLIAAAAKSISRRPHHGGSAMEYGIVKGYFDGSIEAQHIDILLL